MPASLRAHTSRGVSSRPYDRRSPTASPTQSETTQLSPSVPPPSPIQATDLGTTADQGPNAHEDGTTVGIPQDRPGLPTHAEYKRIEAAYLQSLSPRKRDKALITQAMFDKIWDVLHQPEGCTVETPQFRFWVRKMFTLSRPLRGAGADRRLDWSGDETGTGMVANFLLDADTKDLATAEEIEFAEVVLHENRPVAIMEQLYELFCYCHVRSGHGGRDKTCAVIREHYSWVPKELTAQFVKACPTCMLKRSGYAGTGSVGMDIGVVAQKRVLGRCKRKGRAVPSEEAEETTAGPVAPPGLGWPTTGGPLDPGNPEPCGVRERGPELEGLHTREDVGVCLPSVSPAFGSRVWSVPVDVPLIPRALALLVASPFYVHSAKGIQEEKENHSPAKDQLPCLASILFNESLGDHVNLAGLGPGDGVEGLLPPALQPLRLPGPVPESDIAGQPPSYPLQIDPVLLSFNYPGLGISSGPLWASEAGADAVSLGLRNEALSDAVYGIANTSGVNRLRSLSDVSMKLPALELSGESDSPDLNFERSASATLPFSLSTELVRNRCGSRHGCRDGPFAMLYPCSADEAGQEFDGSLSFSIMTDA